MGLSFIPPHCEVNGIGKAEARRHTIKVLHPSELPQHGNRSADADIVVIEVAKPSKGQS